MAQSIPPVTDNTPFTLPMGSYKVLSSAGVTMTSSYNGSTPTAVTDTAGNMETSQFIYESAGETIAVESGYPATFVQVPTAR